MHLSPPSLASSTPTLAPAAAAAGVSAAAISSAELDGPVRLSHSRLWEWQREYYQQQGSRVWTSAAIPSFVTANSFVASHYARIILGFISDVVHSSTYCAEEPIRIFELGAGSGKLAFLTLQQLLLMKPCWPQRRRKQSASSDSSQPSTAAAATEACGPLFTYVVSDSVDENIALWRSQHGFDRFIQAGLVDFAVVDAENIAVSSPPRRRRHSVLDDAYNDDAGELMNNRIRLQLSGITLTTATNHNPVLVIANYTFDSLRADAFRVIVAPTGASAPPAVTLQEGFVSLHSLRDYEPDLHDPSLITRFKAKWQWRDVPLVAAVAAPTDAVANGASQAGFTRQSVDYYTGADIDVNATLSSVVNDIATAHATQQSPSGAYNVLVPIGTLRALRQLRALAHGRLALLCADKAYTSLRDLYVPLHAMREPHIALHQSFSLMLNLEFIQRWFNSVAHSAATAPHVDAIAPFASESAVPATSGAMCTPSKEGIKTALMACWQSADISTSTSSGDAVGRVCQLLRETALAFYPLLSFNLEHFAALQRAIRDEVAAPSTRLTFSLLRLAGHEQDVAFKFRSEIEAHVAAVVQQQHHSDKQMHDVLLDLSQLAASLYPLTANRDIAFEVGRLLLSAHQYTAALGCFELSEAHCGTHHVTLYNSALCLYHLNRLEESKAKLDAAITVKLDYTEARVWHQQVVAKLVTSLHRSTSPSSSITTSPPTSTVASTAAAMENGVRVTSPDIALSDADTHSLRQCELPTSKSSSDVAVLFDTFDSLTASQQASDVAVHTNGYHIPPRLMADSEQQPGLTSNAVVNE